MKISEWVDLNTLKLLSQHTSAVAGAAASFWAISGLMSDAAKLQLGFDLDYFTTQAAPSMYGERK